MFYQEEATYLGEVCKSIKEKPIFSIYTQFIIYYF